MHVVSNMKAFAPLILIYMWTEFSEGMSQEDFTAYLANEGLSEKDCHLLIEGIFSRLLLTRVSVRDTVVCVCACVSTRYNKSVSTWF